MGWSWWLLLGGLGIVLAIMSAFELFLFSIAAWPSMVEAEQDFGMETPNKRKILLFMAVRPSLSILVGLGASIASALKLIQFWQAL
jgi:hypothetical protein